MNDSVYNSSTNFCGTVTVHPNRSVFLRIIQGLKKDKAALWNCGVVKTRPLSEIIHNHLKFRLQFSISYFQMYVQRMGKRH